MAGGYRYHQHLLSSTFSFTPLCMYCKRIVARLFFLPVLPLSRRRDRYREQVPPLRTHHVIGPERTFSLEWIAIYQANHLKKPGANMPKWNAPSTQPCDPIITGSGVLGRVWWCLTTTDNKRRSLPVSTVRGVRV